MDETPKNNKCQYCGKEYKNVPVHERFCKLNPEIRKANVEHEKEKEQVQEQKPVIISDVIPHIFDEERDMLPWFEDENGNRKVEVPRFVGIHERIPCVLVMDMYGRLVPPYIVQGFIGMHPKYHEFIETISEPQPKEEEPIIASSEPITSADVTFFVVVDSFWQLS